MYKSAAMGILHAQKTMTQYQLCKPTPAANINIARLPTELQPYVGESLANNGYHTLINSKPTFIAKLVTSIFTICAKFLTESLTKSTFSDDLNKKFLLYRP